MKKRGLSLLLAILMVVSVFSPAFPSFGGIIASALMTNSYPVELAFNNLFVFDKWAKNDLSTTVMMQGDGALATDIENGSFVLSKTNADAAEVFTAFSLDTANADNNANYYTIDVEPNTTYSFLYTLENTTYTMFSTYVFYYNEKNLAITEADGVTPRMSAAVATNLNGVNSWNFTTPADADHIQVRFTVTGVGTATGTVKDIIIKKVDVLPLGNIFKFSEWANNANSNALASAYGLGNGTHQVESATGSISFEASGAIFTNFNLSNAEGYYTMDVEPGAVYSVSYSLLNCSLLNAGVALAWCTESGAIITTLNLYATNSNGWNSHYITTPDNAATLQIAFGAFHGGSTGVATFKDISVSRQNISNLFDVNGWASNPQSSAIYVGAGTGAVAPDTANKTLNFAVNATADAVIYTGFGIDEANPNNGFYTVDVEPNTEYTLYYNFSSFSLPGPVHFQPHIVELDKDNKCIRWQPSFPATTIGSNSVSIVTQPNTARVMIVFAVFGAAGAEAWTCSVRDIMFYASDIETITGVPHRDTYTYTYNGENAKYGTLPEANAPEGYVFSGWFTGEDGTGERITPETYVKMSSMSVFAYYEPEVDSLELASAPNKTVYTVGEKLDTTGLSLKATQNYIANVYDENGNLTGTEPKTRTFYINSNIYCTPEYLNTTGTQTITAHYGGKTVTFPVTVLAYDTSDIVVNGTLMSDVHETNGKYTLNVSADSFNRYKITYATDSYVRGIITFSDNYTEEFFLEPSDNETFVSFVDDFLAGQTRNGIKTIEFTCLNNELGSFQLKAVATDVKDASEEVVYFNNNEYKMGIDIRYGGVVSELYDMSAKNVTARVYDDPNGDWYYDGNGNQVYRKLTLVDYEEQLNEREDAYKANGTNYGKLTYTGAESEMVNLINTLDRGRYLQQSYYGTSEAPYVPGEFNNSPWKYNPVQGGNVGEEPSKVIDYEITDTYIYVKARPMEWEKWSDAHVDECKHTEPITVSPGIIEYRKMHDECLYGDDVVSDTYMEAWYYFDDGMIKVTNRKVDYSGLPDAYTQQEMPALYLIEPLNHFVYNDVTEQEAWNTDNMQNIEEPEFWGISKDYNDYHYKTGEGENAVVENDKNNDDWYDLFATCNENWAAFTASEDPDSFGVGIYTPSATQLYYGTMPQKYAEQYNPDGTITQIDTLNYRHAETVNPSPEMPTSYIAPLKQEWFRSYEATEYTYYLTTGTAEEIRYDFSTIGDKETAEKLKETKIAVPETVYLNPANNTSGQYYVNNILDEHDYYNVKTEALSNDTSMYFGLHVKHAQSMTIAVTNVTDPSNDIILGNSNGTGNREGESLTFSDTYTSDDGFSLRLSKALSPGQKVTAKWEITVTLNTGVTEKHTVYTVLYAPGRTVGAVAEARQVGNSQNEISSWITGANGVDHSQRAPLGSFHGDYSASGYFKADPLYNDAPASGSGETANDYINTATAYSENAYVLQTATNGHDHSSAQSYLGLLTVDKSRYSNTNQIPNLRIGYDALRIGDAYPKNSLENYTNYYTLGTSESFTSTSPSATPSGWTTFKDYDQLAEVIGENNFPFRETLVPSYDVSQIDGKYIHALNRGESYQIAIARRYSLAATSVLCSVTDKSALRDAVLEGYNRTDANAEFIEKLENAATVLGDPSATQTEIDNARKDLNEITTVEYYALKYDNIFSAYEFSQHESNMTVHTENGTVSYENGSITFANLALEGNNDTAESYTSYGSTDNYFIVDVKPNTEYIFEYDVETNGLSQAIVFLYTATGADGDVPTNISIQRNGGAWENKNETNPWVGTYKEPTGKYVVKFTTGPNTTKAGVRFGNNGIAATISTFSNIKLVEADKYYAEVDYPATETVYKENTAYGTLPTLTRVGYTFTGWKDTAGNTVTGDNLAIDNLSIYSQWTENTYTLNFNGNGGAGSTTSAIITVSQNATIPTNFTMDNHTLVGWAYTANATKADFKAGQTVALSDVLDRMDGNNQLTLYAVWEKNYSVYYSSNGGIGTVDYTYNPRSQAHILPDDSTISRDGYEFLGWALTPDATSPDFYPGDKFYVGNIDSQYVNETKQEVILHAVWAKIGPQNVTFDNLVDISAWSDTVTSGTPVNKTDTGFTVKTNADKGESYCSSAYFPIEAGHKYIIEADVKGDNWDIYFFYCNENGGWVNFNDGKNDRMSSNGTGSEFEVDGIHYTSAEFVVPAGAVNGQLRVDANGAGNAVRFENIRVYDVTERTYLTTVNKYVDFGEAYGKLPVPVKDGQQFLGWVDEKGNTVTADSIMNSTSTVFLKSTWTTNPNTVNDDTVVIEYGLPVVINVLSNDKAGSVVGGVGTKGLSDADLGKMSHPTSKLTDKANNLTLTNGNVVLNNDGTITYTPTKTNVTTEEVFYYEAVINGSYYYAKVTVIPATTIYFEDTFFKYENSTVTKNGKTYNYNWEEVGTSVGEVFQNTDRPGAFNFKDDANNVYGYDSTFDSKVAYSGGTAHFVEVDQIAGSTVPKAIFTFTGTGFDLFSATDNKSGTITTTIYRGTAIDSSKRVQGIMTNAYFGYAYDDAVGDYVPTSNGALFQVPVIRARDLSYDTYTVVVEPRYNKAFDVAGTGECGVYVDSVRIYDPMGGANAVANEAYKADGEYAPQFLEIRDTLVKSKGDGTFDINDLGQSTSVFLDGGKTSLEDFAKLGPKNEVYLGQNDAVTFHIVTDRAELPSTIQIGMSLTGKGGSSADVKLMNTDYNSWVENITLNSTSERYYNIEAVVDWVEQPDGTYKTAAPVIVTNTSSAIISLTSIKWAFNSEDNVATVLDLVTDEMTPVLAMAALNRALNPEATPQQTILNKDNISFEFTGEPYTLGDSGVITITTEQGVSGVTVNGTDVFNCEINEDGKLEWIFEFDADSAGSMTFEIIARDEQGFTSESIYATTNVENDIEDGEDTPTQPDGGDSDDTEGDSGNNNVVTGPESFVSTLLNGIFNIIRKILGLILGGATV